MYVRVVLGNRNSKFQKWESMTNSFKNILRKTKNSKNDILLQFFAKKEIE